MAEKIFIIIGVATVVYPFVFRVLPWMDGERR